MASTLGCVAISARPIEQSPHAPDSSLVEHQAINLSVAGSNPAPTHRAPLTRTCTLFARPAVEALHAKQLVRLQYGPLL